MLLRGCVSVFRTAWSRRRVTGALLYLLRFALPTARVIVCAMSPWRGRLAARPPKSETTYGITTRPKVTISKRAVDISLYLASFRCVLCVGLGELLGGVRLHLPPVCNLRRYTRHCLHACGTLLTLILLG